MTRPRRAVVAQLAHHNPGRTPPMTAQTDTVRPMTVDEAMRLAGASYGIVAESRAARALAAEVERLRTQRADALAQHPCKTLANGADVCPKCTGPSGLWHPWPCPTAKALGGAA